MGKRPFELQCLACHWFPPMVIVKNERRGTTRPTTEKERWTLLFEHVGAEAWTEQYDRQMPKSPLYRAEPGPHQLLQDNLDALKAGIGRIDGDVVELIVPLTPPVPDHPRLRRRPPPPRLVREPPRIRRRRP